MGLTALIGGTGLDEWPGEAERLEMDTPWGAPSAALQTFTVEGRSLLFLPRHGDAHQHAPHRVNYRANLWTLREAGVRRIVAVNAVGGISADAGPGALVVPNQLIDYTWGREGSFFDGSREPLQHLEFGQPFSHDLRRALLRAARAAGLAPVDGGCIAVTQGPRLETDAEVERLARDGCDLVGMTTAPEAALARELDMEYACLAVVANWAAGCSSDPISMSEIEATLAKAMVDVRRLVQQLLTSRTYD